MNNIHKLRVKTIITHRDAMGNIKYERVIGEEPKLPNTIDYTIYDRRDRIIKEVKGIPMQSLVGNFCKVISRKFLGESINYTTVTGSLSSSNPFSMEANTTSYNGLRVGTGTTAITMGDYDLAGRINPGSGSGQLTHGSSTIAYTVGTSVMTNSMYRSFTNESGSTINIRELGIMGGTGDNTSNYDFCTLIGRDLQDKYGSDINIDLLNGQTVAFTTNLYSSLSEGWVRGIGSFFYVLNRNAVYQAFDTDNNWVNLYFTDSNSSILGPASDSTYGILVGTGNTTISTSNYTLEGKIEHGTGTGQLTHEATQKTQNYTVVGDTASCKCARNFINNSGAEITIRNMGIVCANDLSTTRVMFFNKLTGNIVLAASEPVTISQIFEISV